MMREIDSKEGVHRLLQYYRSKIYTLEECYNKHSSSKAREFARFFDLWYNDKRACGNVKIIWHNKYAFNPAYPFRKDGYYWLIVRAQAGDVIYQFSEAVFFFVAQNLA